MVDLDSIGDAVRGVQDQMTAAVDKAALAMLYDPEKRGILVETWAEGDVEGFALRARISHTATVPHLTIAYRPGFKEPNHV